MLEMKHEVDQKQALEIITELTMNHYLVGVSTIQPTKKREIKAQSKIEETPLKLNFIKFLADERKQAVLEVARTKLHLTTDDSLWSVFNVMQKLDQNAHLVSLANQEVKPKLHGMTAQQIH